MTNLGDSISFLFNFFPDSIVKDYGNIMIWKWTAQEEPWNIKHLIKLPTFYLYNVLNALRNGWNGMRLTFLHFFFFLPSSFPPPAEEVKNFTCRLISCDTCSCMAGCCWVWSLSSFSCHKSSAEICNRPGRHPAYLLRRSTNSKILLPWYLVSRCQVYDSALFLLYILCKDVNLAHFSLKTFKARCWQKIIQDSRW